MAITDLTGTTWKFKPGFDHVATANGGFIVEARATFGDIVVDIPQQRDGGSAHLAIYFWATFNNALSSARGPIVFPTYSRTQASSNFPYSAAHYISPQATTNPGKWVIKQYPNASTTGMTETVYDGDAYITFTGGEDVTNSDLISYMEQIAALVVDSAPTEITYIGAAIATVESGQTATLQCAGEIAKTDISVVFGSDGAIAYGEATTEVAAGKTATLACAGKKMAADVVITAI